MDLQTLAIILMPMTFWGIGSFIAKLATNRIGESGVFWDMLGYAPAIIIYSFIVFKTKTLLHADRLGIALAILAGAVGSLGAVGFYLLLTRRDASTAAPLAALAPALTAILAFIFLKEELTAVKGIGIVLATIAVYLLSI